MEWTAASLFAGIGGFEYGLAQAGVRTVASVEIDDKARGVLRHRFPEVTLFNDVQEVTADDIIRAGFVPERGILTAGFPCQDVSLAGKRAGLAGSRTGLFWEIIRIARELQPKWFLLENVPGLLTSNGGRDMGTVVGALVELGYGVGWRVLDAQHFGVPQRRRRVFLAGCLGDPAGAGEVLLEPEGSEGDLASGGAPGQEAPGALADGAVRRRGPGLLAERGIVQGITSSLGTGGPDAQHAQAGWLIPERLEVPDRDVAGTLTTRYRKGVNSTLDDGALALSFRKSKRARDNMDDESWLQEDFSNTLNCFDVGETRATQLVTFAFQPHRGGPGDNLKALETEVSPSLTSTDLAKMTDRGLRVVSATGEVSHTLTASGCDASEDGTGRGWPTIAVEGTWGVRRLTPMECERLQGFPDGHTAERWDFKKERVVAQSDTARGHQLGNAVATPVITWIGRRMVAVGEGSAVS
jgi:DNA (cytosine-5)-methyltransferase 1